MIAPFRIRITYANVVASLALFIALGSGAYAAVTVTGKNVKDGSLSGRDVKNSSLTTADVKDGGLLAADFKAGQLPAGPAGARTAWSTEVGPRYRDLGDLNDPGDDIMAPSNSVGFTVVVP